MMAKRRDFIERENRTTISGIIAIVLIVFLIATFMRVNEIGPFATKNIQGSATADSFIGVRHVELDAHEAYVGHLLLQGVGQRTYYAYPEDEILVVDYGTSHRQTMLREAEGAPGIYSGVYDDRATVEVLVNTLTAQIYVSGLTNILLPPLSATQLKVYDGTLRVAGDEYYFQLVGDELAITSSAGRAKLVLQRIDGSYQGVWDGKSITIDPEDRILTIDDFY